MRKCKLCGKFYIDSPEYCDCGGNEFEIIEESSQRPNNKPSFKDILSWVIFGTCVVLAILVWIFL